MKKLLILSGLCAAILISSAQSPTESQYRNLHSLEAELVQAHTPKEKTDALISLYIYHSAHSESFNKVAAQQYQQKIELFTHQTGQPELIAAGLLAATYFVSGDELNKRALRLYQYAKMHNLDFFKALAKLREARYTINSLADYRTNQLLAEVIQLSKNFDDSSRIIVMLQLSNRYNSVNNYLQALQFAFQASETASKMQHLSLMQVCYTTFEEIYRNLRDYNKALDYALKNLDLLKQMSKPHVGATIHAHVASFYFILDMPVLGNYHMNEAFRLADSIKGSNRLYNAITGNIAGALTFSTHNDVLKDFLKKYRQHFFILPGAEFLDYVTLARAYAKTGEMDSAKMLTQKATDYFKTNDNPDVAKKYYYTLARIATHDKDWAVATENYKNALQEALSMHNLNDGIDYTDSLNKILVDQKQYPEAVKYYSLGDSLQKMLAIQLDKEELTRQEVAALEKEEEIQAIEKEKEKKQRHNVQYLGITFGVVALFISLLIMGIFKVSPRTIKILSFFSFLLFFEFIFLIFKKKIAVFTHGEPWMDLAFMVLLAAVMVPLHHWSEHKVVAYLSSKKISFPTLKTLRQRTITKK